LVDRKARVKKGRSQGKSERTSAGARGKYESKVKAGATPDT
jgi:hypothetical protein